MRPASSAMREKKNEATVSDLISKTTRNAFRKVLVAFTLAEIDTLFGNEDFVAADIVPATISGQRRSSIEQYYAGMDFQNPGQMARLARVYDEIIDNLVRATSRRPDFLPPTHEIEMQRERLADLLKKMARDGFQRVNDRFEHQSISTVAMQVQALTLTQGSVTEHVEKARAKIATGDFSGAITSAYTLVEALLKALLQQIALGFNESEGDIRQLYNLLKGPMNLDPKEDAIDRVLKPILDGFQKQVGGLYELANKASDRHVRRYNPARHHAKLAVNCAVTLCEFLLESHEHQQELAKKRQAS
jgi:hypothetical protein